MCGRFTQYRGKRRYAAAVGWDTSDEHRFQGNRVGFFNLAPGMYPNVLHTLACKEEADTLHWGYQPPWAAEKRIPMSINARVETAAAKPYFRHMFREGRIIIPADGWYEWIVEQGHKQPWYIRLKTDEPMFFAAICNHKPYTNQEGKPVRFVIVTAQSDQGMVDVHDRRPIVFNAEDARIWMDNTTSVEQANRLARHRSVGIDAFEWYKVSKGVNRVGQNEDYFIEPIGDS